MKRTIKALLKCFYLLLLLLNESNARKINVCLCIYVCNVHQSPLCKIVIVNKIKKNMKGIVHTYTIEIQKHSAHEN